MIVHTAKLWVEKISKSKNDEELILYEVVLRIPYSSHFAHFSLYMCMSTTYVKENSV